MSGKVREAQTCAVCRVHNLWAWPPMRRHFDDQRDEKENNMSQLLQIACTFQTFASLKVSETPTTI